MNVVGTCWFGTFADGGTGISVHGQRKESGVGGDGMHSPRSGVGVWRRGQGKGGVIRGCYLLGAYDTELTSTAASVDNEKTYERVDVTVGR